MFSFATFKVHLVTLKINTRDMFLVIWQTIYSDGNFCIDYDLISSGRGLMGTLRTSLCFCFFNWLLSGHPGQARCQTASWVLRPSVCGPTLAGEMAVFCLIRSSKQAVIKKQLLTSPLGHTHTHIDPSPRTQQQTCCIVKSHPNTSLRVVLKKTVSSHLEHLTHTDTWASPSILVFLQSWEAKDVCVSYCNHCS